MPTLVLGIAPVLALVICGCAALGLLVWGVLDRQRHAPVKTMLNASHGVMLALMLATLVSLGDWCDWAHWVRPYLDVADDHYIRVVLGLVYFLSTLVLYGTYRYLHAEHILHFEYPILLLFSVMGVTIFLTANDLIYVFMGLELQSLALYVMVAMNRQSGLAGESAVKYFVLGALSTALILYGISFVYGYTGTTNFHLIADQLNQFEHAPPAIAIGFMLVLAGIGFKISAAPFHMWTPDVYQGAPLGVVAFMATVPKLGAVGVLVRLLLGPFGQFINTWQGPLQILCVLSMLVGVLGALSQTNLRRMLAYSTIAHVGYLLAGVSCASLKGAHSVLVYMMLYGVASVGVFMTLLSVRRAGEAPVDLQDLSGLSRTHPLVAAALTVFMLSLAGLPPFAGFFAKFDIIMAAADDGFVPLAVVMVLSSVVGAFYYLRILKIMYVDPAPDYEHAHTYQNVHETGLVIVICALITTLYVALPQSVLQYARAGANVFFSGQ